MILYDAVDVKAGSDQVIEIRAGNELLWAAFENLWMFDIPTPGTEIQLKPTIAGSVQINWGDGEIDTLTNNISINHTYLMELPPSTWSQLGQDIDGEVADDRSGWSVSINSTGDRVAIGAIGNDNNGDFSGHTRIYEYNDVTQEWVQFGQDIDGEAAYDYSGYSVSINADGDRVAIGAYYNDGNGNFSGHTRIYEYSNGTWSQLGSDIDGEAAGDQSGYSVSINADGDRVAIGATGNDDNGSSSGHVRIFEYNISTQEWEQLGSNIDSEAAADFGGWSVSMNSTGNRVAIGAPYNDGNGTSSGHTRIYEFSNGIWTQLGQDIDGEAVDDRSGVSVSMNAAGNRVAIGAFNNDGNGINSGHTRIYEYSNGTWSKLGSDIDGEDVADNSGYSVSMNAAGDRVAIGARYNAGVNGTESGHTRIYEYSNGTWSKLGQDIDGEAAGDRSGWSVSMNSTGDRVAIGAYLNDGINGTASGHTRIYKLG